MQEKSKTTSGVEQFTQSAKPTIGLLLKANRCFEWLVYSLELLEGTEETNLIPVSIQITAICQASIHLFINCQAFAFINKSQVELLITSSSDLLA